MVCVGAMRGSPVSDARSKLLDVSRRHILRRVGVTLDVALRAVAQPPLQFVGIGVRSLRQLEGKRMAQVVGAQRRDASPGLWLLGVVPAPDLRQQAVDGPR